MIIRIYITYIGDAMADKLNRKLLDERLDAVSVELLEVTTEAGSSLSIDPFSLHGFGEAISAAQELDDEHTLEQRLQVFMETWTSLRRPEFINARFGLTDKSLRVAYSVAESPQGVEVPITVYACDPPEVDGEAAEHSKFDVIDGNTRLLGIAIALLTDTKRCISEMLPVPCDEFTGSVHSAMAYASTVNFIRQDAWSDQEMASHINRMIETGIKAKDIPGILALDDSFNKTRIGKIIKLAKDAPALLEAVGEGTIMVPTAEQVAAVTDDPEEQRELADKIAVRTAEREAELRQANIKKQEEERAAKDTRGRKPSGGRSDAVQSQARAQATEDILGGRASRGGSGSPMSFQALENRLVQTYAEVLHLFTLAMFSYRPCPASEVEAAKVDLDEWTSYIVRFAGAEARMLAFCEACKLKPREDLDASSIYEMLGYSAKRIKDGAVDEEDVLLVTSLLAVRTSISSEARHRRRVTVGGRADMPLESLEEEAWKALGLPLQPAEKREAVVRKKVETVADPDAPKKGRGRPRKEQPAAPAEEAEAPKRGRGRPRKEQPAAEAPVKEEAVEEDPAKKPAKAQKPKPGKEEEADQPAPKKKGRKPKEEKEVTDLRVSAVPKASKDEDEDAFDDDDDSTVLSGGADVDDDIEDV